MASSGLGILPYLTYLQASDNPTAKPLLLLIMNSKRLWATAAAIFALSAFGLHSSVVWAQKPTAVCLSDWEWVCFIQACSSSKRGRLCLRRRSPRGSYTSQNQNSLGQNPCTIFSVLDAGCRDIGECTHDDCPTGSWLTCAL